MKILCSLSLHKWFYPKKMGDLEFVKGTHRYCKRCGKEQAGVLFGGWIDDNWTKRDGVTKYKKTR